MISSLLLEHEAGTYLFPNWQNTAEPLQLLPSAP
jgi:hypothetical protein